MKAAVVGCGNISRFHFNSIITNPLAELTAICDVNGGLAESRAKQYGLEKYYTSIDELLKKENIDVLHVLTPPKYHSEVAVKALNKGIHVLVEKPMATNVKEADDMIKAAEANNVKLCVNHNMLFDPTFLKTRDIVNSFEFGDLLHADAYFAFDTRRVIGNRGLEGTWFRELKGHFLQDLLPHPACMLLEFMRDFEKSFIIRKELGGNDKLKQEVRVLLDSKKTTGSITLSLSTHPDIFTLNLYGTKMVLKIDLSNMSIVRQKPYNIPKAIARGVDNLSQSFQIMGNTIKMTCGIVLKRTSASGGMGNLINAFYTSLDKDWPVPVSGEDAKKIVELSEKIWK
ncbi:Gfo/Idh/MocA family oxidoreductase [candidate division KSB1 bacterium]|nr:Gfo/Idh/MocA family oxidoreductase [candidate division KSB1 bacterium]